MRSVHGSVAKIAERSLSGAILALILAYTYARYFQIPYIGFSLGGDGVVSDVFVQGDPAHALQIGDRVISVGPIGFAQFQADYRASLFDGEQTGQNVPIVVERDGRELTVDWRFPGLNPSELQARLFSATWLSFFFWIAGTLTAMHLRPRGESRNLAVAFNYITAVWIAVGGTVAFYHTWYSAFLVRMVVWFSIPVYWHFHWVWPRSLRRLPGAVVISVYLAAAALSVAEAMQILPRNLYLAGLFAIVGGSLLLLLVHAIFQPQVTRTLRWLLVVVALALMPLLAFPVLRWHVAPPVTSFLGLIGLPFIPLAYFAAIYRRQLADFEVRINRLVSLYAFLVLQGLVMLPLITVVAFNTPEPVPVLVVGAATGIISAALTVLGYLPFQSFLERRLLGVPLGPQELVGALAARIPSCSSVSELAELLRREIVPSLLVRQFVFLNVEGGHSRAVLAMGVDGAELPGTASLPQLVRFGDRYRPASSSDDDPYPWIRLVIPLRVGEALVGLWLLGRRDPDDIYSQSDISLIRSLANQTAIALSNIAHAETLRALYQADVTRHEEERLRLALKLHDTVLNQMAATLMKLDASSPVSEIQSSYEELANLVRGIATDLRPPMLAYGLTAAIEELAEDQMERGGNLMRIPVNLASGETRYPAPVELHVFRIVQESCENALRHAEAATIAISGRLDPEHLEIHVQDDGVGFEMPIGIGLDTLIQQKHFGLAGLVERANLIGAQLRLISAPGHGTRVSVTWKAPVR